MRTASTEDSSGANTSGCRSRKPVSTSPARNAWCRSTRTSRSRLETTPCSWVRVSAEASIRAASCRVGAQATSLASIGVVVHADHRAVHHPGVQPQAGLGQRAERAGHVGHREAVQRAGRGQPGVRRILGADPHLDGVPADRRRTGHRQAAALGHQQLQADQVVAGDALGDRVLDLQARGQLEEPEVAVGVEQELDRADADVPDAPGPR